MNENSGDRIVIQSRENAEQEIVVRSNLTAPYPASNARHFDVNISWLLRLLDMESLDIHFEIDRSKATCFTPRRNRDVETALEFFSSFRDWARSVHRSFSEDLFPVQLNYNYNNRQDEQRDTGNSVKPNVAAITAKDVFVPVVPLFEDLFNEDDNDNNSSSNQMKRTAIVDSASTYASTSNAVNRAGVEVAAGADGVNLYCGRTLGGK